MSALPNVPGISRRADGRVVIEHTPAALYGYARAIRASEALLLELFSKGQLSGTTHTCIGQEFCQMAVVRALDHADDAVLSNHRNHGHFLSYSGEFLGLIAEVMGRADGVNGGRGGSQHMAWKHFHSNGVQAGMTGIGVGLARARADTGSSGIVAVMIGDGTLGEGLLYESMNLASVWSAPVLFVVEHNGIAQTTDTSQTIGGDVLARGAAFGLLNWRVADDDPALWEIAEKAVARVRSERRPGFLVIDTCRLGPHSKGDDLRSESQMAIIRARDPVMRLGDTLSASARTDLDEEVARFIAGIEAAAMTSPDSNVHGAIASLFERAPRLPKSDRAQSAPLRTVRAALNATLDKLLANEPRTLILGEDLHDPYGGAFKVTQGLSQKYPGRVISTPISEAALTGAAIGLALAGRLPIVEIMFADFLTLCADQLYNHAVKFPGIFTDQSVPLVIRAAAGGRRGYGPTHSQSPENIFSAIPGLTVIYGSQRHNNAELLENAVLHWPFPTLFLEHKLVYGANEDQGGYQTLPVHPDDIGGFPTLIRGASGDAVILTYGGMVPFVEDAAARLADDEELAVDIVILSQLAPLPRYALADALLSYSIILIAEETQSGFGVGAEIAAVLAEAGFRGTIRRLGAPPVPIPSARSLEREILPDVDAIAQAILKAI